MYTFDLKLSLFVLLLYSGLLIGTTALLVQWWARRRQPWRTLASLQSVLANTPVAVGLFDQQGNLVYANPAIQRLLALAPNVPLLPENSWHAHLRADLQEAQRPGRHAGCYRIETLPKVPEQPLTIRWWVTRWQDVTLFFAIDITTQQRSEQNAQLLLSDLAHELRTPLATLLTHLQVLQLPGLSTELRGQSLSFMQAEVQRLVRLSNHLVDLGRLQTQPQLAQALDLAALVESAVGQVRLAAAERQMQIGLTVQGPLSPVLGDPDRLRQLFLNLLENALKYGDPGNRITVQLTASAQGVACLVGDTGPGIAAAHLPHLTRRFYRAAPAGVAGSGLGLALVAEILQQHQSHLEIESQTAADTHNGPVGTTMRFVLPIVTTTPTPPQPHERSHHAAA
ncbi:MAG: hypothetical protein KF832_17560 [Caldilineaceae bacterium]|nr:hypothetical protein [Caldilineaceae bacterium]